MNFQSVFLFLITIQQIMMKKKFSPYIREIV